MFTSSEDLEVTQTTVTITTGKKVKKERSEMRLLESGEALKKRLAFVLLEVEKSEEKVCRM